MSRLVGKRTAQSGTSLANRLRIIGGRWRGRRISFPPVPAIRPSPDRVRETLFNWLQPIVLDSCCLDLFAGSGALGLEALSRGAQQVTFVEREPAVGRYLKQTLERLGATNAEVVVEDARRFLERRPRPFDIVFLDPPFDSNLLDEVLSQLTHGWLAPSAHVYIECPAKQGLPELPAGWLVHRSKQAGQVGYHLVRAASARGDST